MQPLLEHSPILAHEWSSRAGSSKPLAVHWTLECLACALQIRNVLIVEMLLCQAPAAENLALEWVNAMG
jgi:hypothetical protein